MSATHSDGLAKARTLRDSGDVRGAVRLARQHAGGARAAAASDLLVECAVDLMRTMGSHHSASALDEIEEIFDDAHRLAPDQRRRDDVAGMRAAVRQTRANLGAPAPSSGDRERFREGFARWIAPDVAAGRHSDAIRSGRRWLAQEKDPAIRAQIMQFLGPYANSDDPNGPVVGGAGPGGPPRGGRVAVALLLALVVGVVVWLVTDLPVTVIAGAIAVVVALVLLLRGPG